MNLREYSEKDLKDVSVILMRVDFNVPVKKGKIIDDTRIKLVVPEIEKLLKHGKRIILLSHLGRPEGKRSSEFSFRPVVHRLSKLIAKPVQFSDEIIGPGVKSKIGRMKPGSVMILENLRFDSREVLDDAVFAKELAFLGDIYINNAFGVSHRKHTSISAITKYLPSFAGSLLVHEVNELSKNLLPPTIVVMGGIKLKTKVQLIECLAQRADAILVGGGIAVTLLSAKLKKDFRLSGQKITSDELILAKKILKKYGNKIILPTDVLVSRSDSPKKVTPVFVKVLEDEEYIFDIGPDTIAFFSRILSGANSIIWNGPMGYVEKDFAQRGTLEIGKIISKLHKTRTVVGGGDIVSFLKTNHLDSKIDFISSGGGSMIAFLGGVPMPGILPLMI